MTVAHSAHRSGSTAPAPRTGADPSECSDRDQAVRDLRRAADVIVAASATEPVPACEGAADCARPGVLSVVDADDRTGRTSRLCGLHAMTAVFTATTTLTVVHPGL